MNESRAYLEDLFYTLSLFTDFHAVVGALGEYAYAILVLFLLKPLHLWHPLLLLVLDGPEGALQLFDALPHLLVDVGQGFELVPQV